MSWRLIFAAALLTLTLGCDRTTDVSMRPSLVTPASVSIVIVPGGFAFLPVPVTTPLPLTTFGPPPLTNPVTLPHGSSITFFNNGTFPCTPTIPGVFGTGVIVPGGLTTVTLPVTGSFTFGCTLNPNLTVTIVVV